MLTHFFDSEFRTKGYSTFSAWILAVHVFLAVGFVIVILEKAKFKVHGIANLFLNHWLYLSFFGLTIWIVFVGLVYARTSFHGFTGVLLFSVFSVGVSVLYKLLTGTSVPSIFAYFFILAASTTVFRHWRLFYSGIALALIMNGAYSIAQSLSLFGFVNPHNMPVLPLAFETGDGLATFDIRRASGFYFQPLGAAAVYGLGGLIFWKLSQVFPEWHFRMTFLLCLIGLLLSQSWAAIGTAAVFYFALGGTKIRIAILLSVSLFVIFIFSNGLLREALLAEIDIKVQNSGQIKAGLILHHLAYFASHPEAILLGGVFNVGNPFTENSFLSLSYQFGMLPILVLIGLILKLSSKNVRILRDFIGDDCDTKLIAVKKLNYSVLYPFALMFVQNSALIPPVITLLAVTMAFNYWFARSYSEYRLGGGSPVAE